MMWYFIAGVSYCALAVVILLPAIEAIRGVSGAPEPQYHIPVPPRIKQTSEKQKGMKNMTRAEFANQVMQAALDSGLTVGEVRSALSMTMVRLSKAADAIARTADMNEAAKRYDLFIEKPEEVIEIGPGSVAKLGGQK